MQAAVVGAGVVGRRTAALLSDRGHDVTLTGRLPTDQVHRAEVVVLATESMHQVELAEQILRRGLSVVSTADRPDAVRALWTLGDVAQANDATLVVGAACSPGLSSLLVKHLATGLDSVDTITTARLGTGGPTCAREHHRSMSAAAWEVRDGTGEWVRGGSGRTLVWFPEPAGAHDCYRAGLSEPFLLQQAFPQARRIQSLQASTRRDRASARLPMLRPPHPEGLVGAVWVEVRGERAGQVEHRVMAACAPQATAAAAVAAGVAQGLANDESGFSGRCSVIDRDDVPNLLRTLPPDIGLLSYDGSYVARPPSNGPVQAARKWRLPRESPVIAPMNNGIPS